MRRHKKEIVTLKLEYDTHTETEDVDISNDFHLQNIMIGYLYVCNEHGECPHTVSIIKPKDKYKFNKISTKSGNTP